MMDLFGDEGAREARDAALKRVQEHGGNWQEKATMALRLKVGFKGTAEEIRLLLIDTGLEPPHHHNVPGAL